MSTASCDVNSDDGSFEKSQGYAQFGHLNAGRHALRGDTGHGHGQRLSEVRYLRQ